MHQFAIERLPEVVYMTPNLGPFIYRLVRPPESHGYLVSREHLLKEFGADGVWIDIPVEHILSTIEVLDRTPEMKRAEFPPLKTVTATKVEEGVYSVRVQGRGDPWTNPWIITREAMEGSYGKRHAADMGTTADAVIVAMDAADTQRTPASARSRELAAQAWCGPETERKVMDPDLAEEFARILDREMSRVTTELDLATAALGDLADFLGLRGRPWAVVARETVNWVVRLKAQVAPVEFANDTAPPSEADVKRVIQWMLDLSKHVYSVEASSDVPTGG